MARKRKTKEPTGKAHNEMEILKLGQASRKWKGSDENYAIQTTKQKIDSKPRTGNNHCRRQRVLTERACINDKGNLILNQLPSSKV